MVEMCVIKAQIRRIFLMDTTYKMSEHEILRPIEALFSPWNCYRMDDAEEVILFYKGLDVPTRQILDSKGAIPSMKAADAKKAIQDMADHSQKMAQQEGKTFEEAYYTQFGLPFPQGGRYRAAAPVFYQRDNGNPSYQERRQTMEESLSKFMDESSKRHDEKSNLIKEI
nr:hypothetical protein [Tanacetum cinerariifolium]